jgi:hypothetical protein
VMQSFLAIIACLIVLRLTACIACSGVIMADL